jgi:phosphoglycerate dehydrogenase-like enzyme
VPEPVPHVDRVYEPAEADQVLAASDFVLLLLPVTPETRGYMSRARLGLMKPSAYLLNFGRGELIVDADLIEAVKARTIAGAVLDVFTTEPLPAEDPFWGTEGILVLPHIGGGHPTRDLVVAELFVENLSRFLDGRPLLHSVDRTLGY